MLRPVHGPCVATQLGTGAALERGQMMMARAVVQPGDDVAELMAFFGANSVDDVPPTVTLLEPADGAMIEPGTDVLVKAEVSDNFEGYGWRMMIPEAGIESPAYFNEKQWSIKPPKGTFTIRVEALDHDGNIGFAESVIHVGVEPPPDPTTGEPTTGSDTSGTTSDGPSSANFQAQSALSIQEPLVEFRCGWPTPRQVPTSD